MAKRLYVEVTKVGYARNGKRLVEQWTVGNDFNNDRPFSSATRADQEVEWLSTRRRKVLSPSGKQTGNYIYRVVNQPKAYMSRQEQA